MLRILSLILIAFSVSPYAKAQSALLESVKRNPEEARFLCKQFKDLNSQGVSISSEKALSEFAKQQKLSRIDAEILSIYVIGITCPDVY